MTTPLPENSQYPDPLWDTFGLMSEEAFANLMGVAVPRLGIWRGKGYGPAYTKLGKRIFYGRIDIFNWIDRSRITPGEREPSDAE